MKLYIALLILLIGSLGFSQQYDSVVFDENNIDENNEVYKIGNVYIFDYEIIENKTSYKLNENSRKGFEFVPSTSDSIGIDKIHLIVKPTLNEDDRSNPNQTQISFFQGSKLNSFSSTGVADNASNVWIHPIRSGFFSALETCPFPFVKKPLEIGNEWKDEMVIGDGWANEKWGEWTGDLLLKYKYKITGVEVLDTKVGQIECYVIESTANSRLGTTKLKSYYSDSHGFIRYEYDLLTGIKVNMWILDFKTGKEFNSTRDIFITNQYIKQ